MEDARTVLLSWPKKSGKRRGEVISGKSVSIVIRYSDFSTITRQKTIVPFLTKDIFRTGVELLSENWDRGDR